MSNKLIFCGLICNSKFEYIFFIPLLSNKFLCIIYVPNMKEGNVPKFHVDVPNFEVGNVPNFEIGNVPNLTLGNCIQSIITRTGPELSFFTSRDGNSTYARFNNYLPLCKYIQATVANY